MTEEAPEPCWQPTSDGDWCNLHEQLAIACACPPIEEWSQSPYLPPVGTSVESVRRVAGLRSKPGMVPFDIALVRRLQGWGMTTILGVWIWREILLDGHEELILPLLIAWFVTWPVGKKR